jgi:transcription-repair coupling factor (superfamily II helicase)
MATSGLKDMSVMASPPRGRLEVKVNVSIDDDALLVRALTEEIARNGQAFVVVPFVRDIDPTKARLLTLLPNLRIIEAHGQHDDLEARIELFTSRSADVLLATTVIENGIDMPNVNTIVVLDADRFGMSALYQLRGRVGRSTRQAYAYFMTNGTAISVEAEARLMYVKVTFFSFPFTSYDRMIEITISP